MFEDISKIIFVFILTIRRDALIEPPLLYGSNEMSQHILKWRLSPDAHHMQASVMSGA